MRFNSARVGSCVVTGPDNNVLLAVSARVRDKIFTQILSKAVLGRSIRRHRSAVREGVMRGCALEIEEFCHE